MTVIDPNAPAPLTASQQVKADEAEAERKVAEDKANVIAAANLEFQQEVAAASAKRNEALSQFPDLSLAGVAEAAWNLVRGVDPVFSACIVSHREKLMTHAEAVQRTGVPAENPSDFEVEVGRLLAEQKPKAKAATAAESAADKKAEAADVKAAKDKK